VTGTVAESSPIVLISAQLKYNIDTVNECTVKHIFYPVCDFASDPRLIVVRSSDLNKPDAEVDELKGGVAGCSTLKYRVRPVSSQRSTLVSILNFAMLARSKEHSELEISLFLIRRFLAVRTKDEKQIKVSKPAKNDHVDWLAGVERKRLSCKDSFDFTRMYRGWREGRTFKTYREA
jgi:translation initiation factor 2 subunit 3